MLICLAILSFGNFVQPVSAVPITLTLDNPHQTIKRPASGTIVLNFTGTVSFGPNFDFEEAVLDFDYNRSSTSGIPTEFGRLHFSRADNGGSVSGVLFTAEVSSTTVPGLYEFHFGGRQPAEFSIEGSNERMFATVSRSFSILVIVPDQGKSALLLGISFATLFFVQRRLSQ